MSAALQQRGHAAVVRGCRSPELNMLCTCVLRHAHIRLLCAVQQQMGQHQRAVQGSRQNDACSSAGGEVADSAQQAAQ